MGYATILVYLATEGQAHAGIAAAANLARADNGHLTGIYVTPMMPVYGVSPYGGLDVSEKLIAEHRAFHNAECGRVKTKFNQALAGEIFAWEWASADSPLTDPLEAILERGRAAELIVAVRDNPDDANASDLGIAERLMVEAGRPVLLVPAQWEPQILGRNITIAWNNSRESARAVFDALPVLRGAESVHLVSVSASSPTRKAPPYAVDAVAAALAHSGVRCEAVETTAHDHGVGEEIISRAREYGSDLIVMGGYGHSRFREWIFGGVTKHILDKMPMPVLASH